MEGLRIEQDREHMSPGAAHQVLSVAQSPTSDRLRQFCSRRGRSRARRGKQPGHPVSPSQGSTPYLLIGGWVADYTQRYVKREPCYAWRSLDDALKDTLDTATYHIVEEVVEEET